MAHVSDLSLKIYFLCLNFVYIQGAGTGHFLDFFNEKSNGVCREIQNQLTVTYFSNVVCGTNAHEIFFEINARSAIFTWLKLTLGNF